MGRRLVVVVEDGRAEVEVGAGDGPGELQRLPDVVAVVVVRDVLAPVERPRGQVGVGVLALAHVQVDHLGPPVRLDDRRDHVDEVVADLANEVALAHGEPVGQLHEHLGRPRLGGVDRARGPVRGLGGGDEFGGLLGRGDARIGQRAEPGLVHLQRGDRLLGADHDQDHLAAFLGHADREHLDPRRGGGQRAHVRVDLFRVAQDVGRAGDVAEVVERSRHRLAEGEVVDEGGGEEGLGGELADERGVLLVEGLLGGGGERQYGGREGEEGGPEALEQLHRGLP